MSDDGFAAVVGSGTLVSLKSPDHALDFPIKRYTLVERAVEADAPPYKEASESISRNCFELCILKLFVTRAGTVYSPCNSIIFIRKLFGQPYGCNTKIRYYFRMDDPYNEKADQTELLHFE